MRQCTRRGLATIFLPSRCTFHLILSYGRPHSVCSIKTYRTDGLTLYVSLKFIVRPTPRMYVSLKFIVRPTPRMYVSLKFIVHLTPRMYVPLKFIVHSTPRMYVPLKFIVHPTPRMYVQLKFIVHPTPRMYTSKSFSVCFSRKTYALILFISRQNFRRALETVLYLPIGGQIPIFGYCHCYIYRLFLHLS